MLIVAGREQPFLQPAVFGDFVRLGYDEFEAVMEETLNDHRRSYQAMIRELCTISRNPEATRQQVLDALSTP